MSTTALRSVRPSPSSRRGFLSGTAKIAAGGGLALAAAGLPINLRRVLAQVNVSTPVGVLNYALTLEHLEYAFYRDGLAGFASGDFDAGVFDNLSLIENHEGDHVDTLISVIGDLGGTPVAEAEYDFQGAFDAPDAFLATAQALENTGVAAYTGAAQFLIAEDALLTAALTIHGVEARHASYLNRLNGDSPFPDAVDAPKTPAEILAIAGPFIVTAAAAPAPAAPAAGAAVTTMPSTGIGSAVPNGGAEANLALLGLGTAAAAGLALFSRRLRAESAE